VFQLLFQRWQPFFHQVDILEIIFEINILIFKIFSPEQNALGKYCVLFQKLFSSWKNMKQENSRRY